MSLARPLAAAALVTSAFLGGTASANCVGTQNTATACYENRPVYRDCVYTGSDTCREVTVSAPLCLYGTIVRQPAWQTVWC